MIKSGYSDMNEGEISDFSKHKFNKDMKKLADEIPATMREQETIENQVKDLLTELNDRFVSRKLTSKNPTPIEFASYRKDVPLVAKLSYCLPIISRPTDVDKNYDQFDDSEIYAIKYLQPIIDKVIDEIEWYRDELKKIQKVADTAPLPKYSNRILGFKDSEYYNLLITYRNWKKYFDSKE